MNPTDCKNMGEMQQRIYQVHDVNELKQGLMDVYGIVSSKASSMTQLMSGTNVYAREFV